MNIILLLLLIIFGIVIGMSIMFFVYNVLLVSKDKLVNDYKKGIDLHNKRELRLIFINQSIKNYVKQQQNMIKVSATLQDTDNLGTGKYMAYKDIESAIKEFEQHADRLLENYPPKEMRSVEDLND